ncbi:MAG TPA: FAD-dependent oxidoreductase [Hyphomicrobiaceae bacterium]|nr:FAD-dependent oxidoreductase [Hyphomicrobiaceae bacterium]
MTEGYDLIVAGAGPAGANAAIAAVEQGLSVALIDEADAAGGQVYRRPRVAREARGAGAEAGWRGHDGAAGEELRLRLARSGVVFHASRRIASVSGRFRVDVVGPRGHDALEAPYLIAATGAYERVIPFPGWTTPGVTGLAAATILIESEGMLPGRRVAVVGLGPLLAAVAARIVESGGEVAVVADLASRSDWVKAAWRLTAERPMLIDGWAWLKVIRRARIPVLHRTGVRRVEGERSVRRLVVGPVGADGAPVPGPHAAFDVDAVVVGHGLVPSGDIPRLLGADLRHDPAGGGWCTLVDGEGRTTLRGLYAVGDGARIAGARLAPLTGRLAGLAVAREIGMISAERFATLAGDTQAEIARLRPVAAAMARLMILKPGLVDGITGGTIVCRCEDIPRSEIDKAIDEGALSLNALKHFTRCGMGPCQGRMCGESVAELLARRSGRSRESLGIWTPRPPLRPIAIDELIGTFSYADIPIPPPSAL